MLGIVPASDEAPPSCIVGDGEADEADDEDDEEEEDDDDDEDRDDKQDDVEDDEDDEEDNEEDSDVEDGGVDDVDVDVDVDVVDGADVVGVVAATWLVVVEPLPLPDDNLVRSFCKCAKPGDVEEELTEDWLVDFVLCLAEFELLVANGAGKEDKVALLPTRLLVLEDDCAVDVLVELVDELQVRLVDVVAGEASI